MTINFNNPSLNRFLIRAVYLTVLVFSLSSCFRYTPTRREMVEGGETAIAGPEAFEAYQAELRRRLDKLISERASLIGPDAEQSYIIGNSDLLKIDVFGFSDLSGESEVGEDGNISLPLLGMIPAANISVEKLQQELTIRYKRYVKDPKIRVSIGRFSAHQVSIGGSVPKPGWYPLKHSGYLLSELIAEAGGLKDTAGSRVYLIPASDRFTNPSSPTQEVSADANPPVKPAAKIQGVEIDYEKLVGTLDQPALQIPLLPGDTVVVPDAGLIRVAGEVENPGSFPITHRASTLTAVAAAGGFTYAANVNEVELIRDIGDGKKASMTVDLEKVAFHGATDLAVKDGDVLVIPSSPGRFRARQIVEAFRSVFRGGVSGSIKYQ